MTMAVTIVIIITVQCILMCQNGFDDDDLIERWSLTHQKLHSTVMLFSNVMRTESSNHGPSEQDFNYRSTFANRDFPSAISSSRFAKYSDWLRMAINLFRELPISALKKHLLPNDLL